MQFGSGLRATTGILVTPGAEFILRLVWAGLPAGSYPIFTEILIASANGEVTGPSTRHDIVAPTGITTVTIPLTQTGIVIAVCVQSQQHAGGFLSVPTKGMLYAEGSLSGGSGSTLVPLFSGTVWDGHAVGYPAASFEDLLANDGGIQLLNPANPAAGANLIRTYNLREMIRWNSLSMTITAAGGAGNRIPSFVIRNNAGAILYVIQWRTAITAGQAWTVQGSRGAQPADDAVNRFMFLELPDFFMRSPDALNYTFRVEVIGIQAGDTITNVFVNEERKIIPDAF